MSTELQDTPETEQNLIPAEAARPEGGGERPASPVRRLAPIIAGGAVVLVAMCLVVLLALRGMFFGGPAPGMPLAVTKLPFASPVATVPGAGEPLVTSGEVQVPLAFPATLRIAEQTLPVTAVVIESGAWPYHVGGPGTAVWVYGTVVNYVIGLEATRENDALLGGLGEGDEIGLGLSGGTELRFRFGERRRVSADDASIFAQSRPGLTLVLLGGEGNTRLVVMAGFETTVEGTPQPPSEGETAAPGEPVEAGDARVTVIRGYAIAGEEAGLPAGSMYYLVEFSVENVGDGPLNADRFLMELQDGQGNRYTLSPPASEAGEHGLLSGEVTPGQSAEGTAGYLVPEAMAGPTLIWTFSPAPGSPRQARVAIPYAPPAPAVARAVVRIEDAFLNQEGELLIILGEVQNAGEAELTVTLEDVTLSSSAGVGELRAAAPPLPWTVGGGETATIELQYVRPEASSAILTILGFTFEISGLP